MPSLHNNRKHIATNAKTVSSNKILRLISIINMKMHLTFSSLSVFFKKKEENNHLFAYKSGQLI